uniref:PNPLA domain-containing protein n=1 Tax=Amphora coffeiformis TaxID=265554 RepID=A0A7S3LF66_9STRA|mmetsp:Transcript_16635/g.31629  ORF Transcript_16635/g.31629 Transcript_16635/m.31629 type:complete len:258 (-) Transcript_16635:10-783(-)
MSQASILARSAVQGGDIDPASSSSTSLKLDECGQEIRQTLNLSHLLTLTTLHVAFVITGAGFSGFWYHLGLFKSISTLDEYDYFCYSSGCLSIVLGFLNTDVEYAYDVCRDIQIAWSQGRMSSYEIIDEFLERLLPAEEKLFSSLFPRLNIISTSLDSGVEIRQAKNRTELLSYLRRTTRIPLLTGRAWLKDAGQRYVDGGFSRMFHPPCRWTVEIPVTWSTYIHSLNPGVSKERVFEFVELGLSGPNPFLVGSSKC